MEKFTVLTSRLAPLPIDNIDTDQIIPARFLKTISKAGLGDQLFFDWRYDLETPDHVEERPEDFDVVVVDLLMPGLSGEQTLQALREIRADGRVLIVSGYSEGDILGRLGGGRQLGFLAKPFTRATLERRLRELLA